LLPHDQIVQDFQVNYDFEIIGQKTMCLNACKMPIIDGDRLILLAIEDIGDRLNS
jgi:two-component system CheB/CheR fusion protein